MDTVILPVSSNWVDVSENSSRGYVSNIGNVNLKIRISSNPLNPGDADGHILYPGGNFTYSILKTQKAYVRVNFGAGRLAVTPIK